MDQINSIHSKRGKWAWVELENTVKNNSEIFKDSLLTWSHFTTFFIASTAGGFIFGI